MVKPKKESEVSIKYSSNHQTIYSDHLIRFGLGPIVSKLEFGLVNEDDEIVNITTTIITPTSNLLDVLPLINKQSNDENTKKAIVTRIRKILEKFESNE